MNTHLQNARPNRMTELDTSRLNRNSEKLPQLFPQNALWFIHFLSKKKIYAGISLEFHFRLWLQRLYEFEWVLQHKHPTSIITHLAATSRNLLILSSLICIQRRLSCVAAVMKLACSVKALGEVLLCRINMLILNAFCQRAPWWVSVARHGERGRTLQSLMLSVPQLVPWVFSHSEPRFSKKLFAFHPPPFVFSHAPPHLNPSLLNPPFLSNANTSSFLPKNLLISSFLVFLCCLYQLLLCPQGYWVILSRVLL